MPAWYLTIDTPLGERHATIRGEDLKTRDEAVEKFREIQACKSFNGTYRYPQGDITDCIPARWPEHFRGRHPSMDAAYPKPLSKEELLK